MQYCNRKVFEISIRIKFPVTDTIISTENLTDDQENALRYASGFVIRCTQKKIGRTEHPYKSTMLTILNQLKEDDGEESSSYLSYTKLWINKINRGGLTFINDETYYLFLALEYATRGCLAMLIDPTTPNSGKDKVIDRIRSNPDVTFHWCHLTASFEETVSQELLSRLVSQWLTIRGFSMAAAFMEEYKHAQSITLKSTL